MATKQSRRPKQRESLVDWVLRGSPGKANGYTGTPVPRTKPEPEPEFETDIGSLAEPAPKRRRNASGKSSPSPRLVPLKVWGRMLMGEFAPHPNTLRRWVHDGRIYPMPVKIGRGWTVLGWVGAIIWAFKRPEPVTVRGSTEGSAPALRPARQTKTCAFCAEEILAAALRCKHCGSDVRVRKLRAAMPRA